MESPEEFKTFYFPHDTGASYDPKLINLRMKFGWKAIGMYWGIIEALHKEKNGELPQHLISSMIDDYYNQEEIREMRHVREEATLFEESLYANALLVSSNGIATSLRVKENIRKRHEKSDKARDSANARWLDKNKLQYKCERNANAMLESKVKDSKVKKIIKTSEKSLASPTFNKNCLKCNGTGFYKTGGFDVICGCGGAGENGVRGSND